ncbi:hypothetical protein IP88_15345 [alpha proteobacterium AAP81b]|nr:hypothetical protein IP88_15345 [alpha proteobacterium AAP81b]
MAATRSDATNTADVAGVAIFIAAPMSVLNAQDYRDLQRTITELIARVKNIPSVDAVYFAGANIAAPAEFSDPTSAIAADMEALDRCDVFILYYSAPAATSALVELGYALARRKRVLIVAPDESILPFLIRNMTERPVTPLLPPVERIFSTDSKEVLTWLISRITPSRH